MINPLVFRKYDIRGSSITDITADLAFRLGLCFARQQLNSLDSNNQGLGKIEYKNIILNFAEPPPLLLTKSFLSNLICVARDERLSSTHLYTALCQGLAAGGAQVVSVGPAPSPLLYYADSIIKPIASIMITASHNPKDDNGFKIIVKNKPYFGEQIEELYNLMLENPLLKTNISEATILTINLEKDYINRITSDIDIKPTLKILWDPGHGIAANIIKKLFDKLPNINHIINDDVDGNFPNRSPDPSNPLQLIKLVQAGKYDLAVALDGDADRLVVVSGNGEIIEGEQLLYLFAQDVLQKFPKAKIIGDVKISKTIFDQINIMGGQAFMSKTGHPFIKQKMLEKKAILAVEASGHIFFADRYLGYDDGIYAALRFIELIAKAAITTIPIDTHEFKIKVGDDKKFTVIEQIKNHLIKNHLCFNDIDGIRVDAAGYWWLIRASNTEGIIMAYYSADDSNLLLGDLKDYLENLLKLYT